MILYCNLGGMHVAAFSTALVSPCAARHAMPSLAVRRDRYVLPSPAMAITAVKRRNGHAMAYKVRSIRSMGA